MRSSPMILDIECMHVKFDASQRGKKMLNSSRDKNEGMYRSGEGGGGPAM